MDRIPKYLQNLWFKELDNFSRFRRSAGQPKTGTISPDPTKIPKWLQDYTDELYRGFHISADDPNWAETDRDGKLEMATAIIEDMLTPGSGLTYDDSTAIIFDQDGNGYNLYGELIAPATHASLGCLENGKDLECLCLDGKETFTEGTALLAKETPEPDWMGC